MQEITGLASKGFYPVSGLNSKQPLLRSGHPRHLQHVCCGSSRPRAAHFQSFPISRHSQDHSACLKSANRRYCTLGLIGKRPLNETALLARSGCCAFSTFFDFQIKLDRSMPRRPSASPVCSAACAQHPRRKNCGMQGVFMQAVLALSF
jgi:hypothetical protein